MKRVVFLDRDGTLNVDSGFVHRVADCYWTPRAIEALQQLQRAGFTLAVVTNQSGIGHELYSLNDMHDIHAHMQAQLKEAGVTLAFIAFCPHRRDAACDCRKPQIGMARQVEKVIGSIDYAASWTIGDKTTDWQFGVNTGTKTALIRSVYWQEDALEGKRPDLIVDSLFDAAGKIVTSNP